MSDRMIPELEFWCGIPSADVAIAIAKDQFPLPHQWWFSCDFAWHAGKWQLLVFPDTIQGFAINEAGDDYDHMFTVK